MSDRVADEYDYAAAYRTVVRGLVKAAKASVPDYQSFEREVRRRIRDVPGDTPGLSAEARSVLESIAAQAESMWDQAQRDDLA